MYITGQTVSGSGGHDAHDVSSLVRFCCFGAPIPPAIVRQAKQGGPELAVINGWGHTEDAVVTPRHPR